jgi:hypothetical protein
VPEIKRTNEGFIEIDTVKNKLSVEFQFGKCAFIVYDVAARMTVLFKQEIINSRIEIVPVLSLANEMSSGAFYFDQMKTDLEYRGVSNIDIPVLIIGIESVKRPNQKT